MKLFWYLNLWLSLFRLILTSRFRQKKIEYESGFENFVMSCLDSECLWLHEEWLHLWNCEQGSESETAEICLDGGVVNKRWRSFLQWSFGQWQKHHHSWILRVIWVCLHNLFYLILKQLFVLVQKAKHSGKRFSGMWRHMTFSGATQWILLKFLCIQSIAIKQQTITIWRYFSFSSQFRSSQDKDIYRKQLCRFAFLN